MKQIKKRTVYTAEYKAEAVKLVLNQKLSGTDAALRLGMPKQTLDAWVQRARAGRLPKTDNHNTKQVELEAENRRLKQALSLAEMERDILKKAAAYFAKESQRGTRS